MSAWFRRRLASARRWGVAFHGYAIGAAWFFIVISLAHLAWVVTIKWADPAGVTSLYHSTVAGETRHAFGLVYNNAPGLLLALFQSAIVITAAVFTLVPWATQRRAGHLVLVAWSMLWALDLVALTAFDQRIDSIFQASILLLLAGCTVYRALHGWSPTPGKVATAKDELLMRQADANAELSAHHITASERLHDITGEYRSVFGELARRGRIAARCAKGRVEVVSASYGAKMQPRLQSWRRRLTAGSSRMGAALASRLRRHGLIPSWSRPGDSTSSHGA